MGRRKRPTIARSITIKEAEREAQPNYSSILTQLTISSN